MFLNSLKKSSYSPVGSRQFSVTHIVSAVKPLYPPPPGFPKRVQTSDLQVSRNPSAVLADGSRVVLGARADYLPEVKNAELGYANRLFDANVRRLWKVKEYSDIPGVVVQEENMDTDEYEFDFDNNSYPEQKKPNRKTKNKFGTSLLEPKATAEVAFLGRVNSGKSSLMSVMLREKILKLTKEDGNNFRQAKFNMKALDHEINKRPGHTQEISSWSIGEKIQLVDLPGYGYNSTRDQGDMIMEYLTQRKELKRVFLLISADAGIRKTDLKIMDFLAENGISWQPILTKIDKIVKPNRKKMNTIPWSEERLVILDSMLEDYRQYFTKLASTPLRQGGNPALLEEILMISNDKSFIKSASRFNGIANLKHAIARAVGISLDDIKQQKNIKKELKKLTRLKE